MEDMLLGHLLKANDPQAQRLVEEHLAKDPTAPHDMAVLHRALAPLATDKDSIEPPADLRIRTLSRIAEYIVATEGATGQESQSSELIRRSAEASTKTVPVPVSIKSPSDVVPASPRRRNVVGAIALSVALAALAIPAVLTIRARNNQMICKNSMIQFHQGAVGYSDQFDGNFPQVDEGEPVASVVKKLDCGGHGTGRSV